MAVFTVVDDGALRRWLGECGAGALHGLRPTAGGVANTNYFIHADAGRFVLTLFEAQPRDDAERTLALTARLADAGLPVARPWPQLGGWTAPLAGKPAALASWIDGDHPVAPTRVQCAAIGGFLGRLHRVTATAAASHPLPAGIIHSDLFRDNALFDGGVLNGVIDFHYAREAPLVEDLAVAVLDWCWAATGIDRDRLAALGRAYGELRAVTDAERRAFPEALRDAANGIWQARLDDPRRTKDPDEMHARVVALAADTPSLPRTGAAPA